MPTKKSAADAPRPNALHDEFLALEASSKAFVFIGRPTHQQLIEEHDFISALTAEKLLPSNPQLPLPRIIKAFHDGRTGHHPDTVTLVVARYVDQEIRETVAVRYHASAVQKALSVFIDFRPDEGIAWIEFRQLSSQDPRPAILLTIASRDSSSGLDDLDDGLPF